MSKAKVSVDEFRARREEAKLQIGIMLEGSTKEEAVAFLMEYFTTVDLCAIRDQLRETRG